MKNAFILLFVGIWIGCGQPSDRNQSGKSNPSGKTESPYSNQDLFDQTVGIWQTEQATIQIRTAYGEDRDEQIEITRENFPSYYGLKSNRGEYRADSTFKGAYVTLDDELVISGVGRWWIEGDSIVIETKVPEPSLERFHWQVEGDVGNYSTLLDWDDDGERDDLMSSRLVKIGMPDSIEQKPVFE